jgi:hypothetical protein
MELNGLALEYQRDYGTAHRNLDIFDLVNNPLANGKCRIFGFHLQEEISDRFLANVRTLRNDLPDASLIRLDSV